MYASTETSDLTAAAYLTFEQTSLERHEYVAGQVYAMAGGSEAHDLIAGNFYTQLRRHLRGTGCRAFSGNMKVYIETLDIFYYPNVSVTCDPKDTERYFKAHPKLLIEVLSPGTERIDRNEKLINYRRLASLEEYVLVSQTAKKVEVYRRDAAGHWTTQTLVNEGQLTLASVDLTMSMDDIYEDVDFFAE